ncbi:MAG: hypothetical protein RIQ60_3499 [Pseudomonadota bacterium]|jgi:diguanylate cyclase (GGDEF)-like protein/PAS domain S-box-containing protein
MFRATPPSQPGSRPSTPSLMGFLASTSPAATVLRIAGVIFLAELFIMLAFRAWMPAAAAGDERSLLIELLDPVLLSLVVAPLLFRTVWLPMRRQQQELEQHADELRIAAVSFESQSGMLVTDAQGVILRVNRAFTRLTGYTAEEAVGQRPSMLRSGRHEPDFFRRVFQTVHERGQWQGEIWNRRKNGQIYAELLNITAIRDEWGTVMNYVGSFTDITEDKEAIAEIHRLAYYDALTKLPNRRLIHDRLEQALHAVNRHGNHGALLLIDLDHFKQLNDTRGHDVGDLLLTEVAARFRSILRESETVGRQGGDEFVVVADAVSDDPVAAAAGARHLAERILASLRTPLDLNGEPYHCRLSIGGCIFGSNESINAVLKKADLALYQTKAAGRNGVSFYDPVLETSVEQRKRIEAELAVAVEREQFELFYQPQVNAQGHTVGVEALLRWGHPERGILEPAAFIDIAIETGHIHAIGDWVLRQACRQIRLWSADPSRSHLQISVNVSARQFQSADFADKVLRTVNGAGIPPQRLCIELTESHVLKNIDDAIAKITLLRGPGIRFSMDDFGTGYSSLSYLSRLPLDQIKIDQSFVHAVPGHTSHETVARTIITLGRSLGLQVLAEGVERAAQRDFLEQHGCEYFQGFLFGSALPIDAFEQRDTGSRNTPMDFCV